MMEAARTSETSVDNYFTRRYIPEDKSELNTRRRENLKSHIADKQLYRTLVRCLSVRFCVLKTAALNKTAYKYPVI
jgi:hypothetical protein